MELNISKGSEDLRGKVQPLISSAVDAIMLVKAQDDDVGKEEIAT